MLWRSNAQHSARHRHRRRPHDGAARQQEARQTSRPASSVWAVQRRGWPYALDIRRDSSNHVDFALDRCTSEQMDSEPEDWLGFDRSLDTEYNRERRSGDIRGMARVVMWREADCLYAERTVVCFFS